jgi:hypothetical protein
MGPKAAKATKEPGFPWKQNVELERLLFHEVYNILQNKKQSMGTKTAMYERATSNLRALALAREHGKHIADSDGKPAPVDRLTAEVVRQKIGTASKQARKLYSKLKYKDKTGAPCNAKEYANYMDVDKAVDRWRNFAVWVEYFFDHPTWGFGAAGEKPLSGTVHACVASGATGCLPASGACPCSSMHRTLTARPAAAAAAAARGSRSKHHHI